MPKLQMSPESILGSKPVPQGFYELELVNFRVKTAKSGNSLNLNAEFNITDGPQDTPTEKYQKKVFCTWNTSWWGGIDIAHGLGVQLEQDNQGLETVIPGDWEPADPNKPNDMQGAKYIGPLFGKRGSFEVIVTQDQNGNDRNEIRQAVCKVPGCTHKHSTSLAGSKN